jgi:NitT/TauT family transport system permease protein
VPKVAVAPIIVVWLGFGISSKVIIICLLTFFPVLVTAIAGFKAVDADRIDLLRSLSATRWQIFQEGEVPERAALHLRGPEHGRGLQRSGRGGGRIRRRAGRAGGAHPADRKRRPTAAGSFAVCIVLSVIGIALSALLRRVQQRALALDACGHVAAHGERLS